MQTHHLRSVVAAAAAAAALMLGACSDGGGGGNGGGNTTPQARTTDVPDSALASSDGFVAYVLSLLGMTSESGDPVLVGDITAPTDDKAEPVTVN